MLLSERIDALVSQNPHVAWGSIDDDIENEDAPTIDRRLREHAARRARDDYELGRLLRRGFVVRVHVLAGFASFHEYVDRVFGYTGRQTEERLRVAEALERLPGLSVKLAQGELCFSVVRELTRVCTEESELEWIAVAEGRTAREVERMVSGRSFDPIRARAGMPVDRGNSPQDLRSEGGRHDDAGHRALRCAPRNGARRSPIIADLQWGSRSARRRTIQARPASTVRARTRGRRHSSRSARWASSSARRAR
jgi:hypothetical protein